MKELSEAEGKKLVGIARKAIQLFLEKGRELGEAEGLTDALREKKACFVTLHLGGELRGCIGTLEARKELWREVEDKAVSAATEDWRFPPLSKEELSRVKISVSVLSELKEATAEEIRPGMGVVFEKGGRSATFLPCVWEELPGKEEFMGRLCEKAGLFPGAWKEKDAKFLVYTAREFGE